MKIMWSGIGITDGRGKIGGQVASKNRAGAFMRTWSQGTNPQTLPQTVQRARFAEVSEGWRNLDEAQRAAWIVAAASGDWNRVNSLGNTYQPSGFNLFCSVNLAVDTPSGIVTDVPAVISLTPLVLNFFTARVSEGLETSMTIQLNTDTMADEQVLILWFTQSVSPGTVSVKQSLFRLATIITATELAGLGTEFDVGAAYDALFPLPTVGSKVFLQAEVRDARSYRRIVFARLGSIVEVL